jgi:hypothetical protein
VWGQYLQVRHPHKVAEAPLKLSQSLDMSAASTCQMARRGRVRLHNYERHAELTEVVPGQLFLFVADAEAVFLRASQTSAQSLLVMPLSQSPL